MSRGRNGRPPGAAIVFDSPAAVRRRFGCGDGSGQVAAASIVKSVPRGTWSIPPGSRSRDRFQAATSGPTTLFPFRLAVAEVAAHRRSRLRVSRAVTSLAPVVFFAAPCPARWNRPRQEHGRLLSDCSHPVYRVVDAVRPSCGKRQSSLDPKLVPVLGARRPGHPPAWPTRSTPAPGPSRMGIPVSPAVATTPSSRSGNIPAAAQGPGPLANRSTPSGTGPGPPHLTAAPSSAAVSRSSRGALPRTRTRLPAPG